MKIAVIIQARMSSKRLPKKVLKNINEKPENNFLENAGLYLLNPSIINLIPQNKIYDITDLIFNAKTCIAAIARIYQNKVKLERKHSLF